MRGWLLRTRRRYHVISLIPDRTRRCYQLWWRAAFRLVILLAVMLGLFSRVQTAHAAACDVTANTDGNPGGGGNVGELRWAITQANLGACSNLITFHILPLGSTQTITIDATTPLPNITQPVMIDGSTQDAVGTICNVTTGPHPEIVIDASATPAGTKGLWLDVGSDGSEIKGLALDNVPYIAIYGYSNNNTIDCNYIGLAADGTTPAGNNSGIYFLKNGATGPSNNVIGGTTPAARNVVAASTFSGIEFDDATTSGNFIEGNYIGTDASGTVGISNNTDISIQPGVSNTTIGGSVAGAGNVISGSFMGVSIQGGSGNVISGNFIGTDAMGTTAISGSTNGINIGNGSTNNTIGGTTAAERNIISGTTNGIEIIGTGTANNPIIGNYIGTDVTGTVAIPNSVGIGEYSTSSNKVGGTTAAERNIISGNTGFGVFINGNNTTVSGNYIGTDVTGAVALPNLFYGVEISGTASGNTVGGTTAGERNIISGNSAGIFITSTNNSVIGNYIGTDVTGTLALPNAVGVELNGGATNNTVGGTTAGDRNIISGNGGDGIMIIGAGATTNLIIGNYIGTDLNGTAALGNNVGVDIFSGAPNNTVGGTAAVDRNIISANTTFGVLIGDPGTNGNIVQGNFIGTDVTGAIGLPNADGVQMYNNAESNIIGGIAAGAANLITLNNGVGVIVRASTTTDNTIRGNQIYNNTGIGIDLNVDGVTPNDPNDADSGSNDLQNYPILNSLSAVGATYTVTGGLNSVPNSGPYQIDFYSSATCNGSGNGDGKSYLGSTTVSTNASGNASFGPIALSGFLGEPVITMTATNPAGSTSEFSSCTIGPALVNAPPPPSLAVTFPSAAAVPPEALTVSFASNSDLVVNDNPFTLSASITNTSSSTVSDVVVRMQAADAFDVVTTSANMGDTQIVCQLGSVTLPSLAPGQHLTLTVTLQADPSTAVNGETDNVIAVEYKGGRLKTAGKKVAVEGQGSSLPSTGYPPPAAPPVSPAVAILLLAASLTAVAFISTRIRKRATGRRS